MPWHFLAIYWLLLPDPQTLRRLRYQPLVPTVKIQPASSSSPANYSLLLLVLLLACQRNRHLSPAARQRSSCPCNLLTCPIPGQRDVFFFVFGPILCTCTVEPLVPIRHRFPSAAAAARSLCLYLSSPQRNTTPKRLPKRHPRHLKPPATGYTPPYHLPRHAPLRPLHLLRLAPMEPPEVPPRGPKVPINRPSSPKRSKWPRNNPGDRHALQHNAQ